MVAVVVAGRALPSGEVGIIAGAGAEVGPGTVGRVVLPVLPVLPVLLALLVLLVLLVLAGLAGLAGGFVEVVVAGSPGRGQAGRTARATRMAGMAIFAGGISDGFGVDVGRWDVFRTGDYLVIQAALFNSYQACSVSFGVRYPSPEWSRF